MDKRMSLNSYLGTTIQCKCGRNHSTSLKAVDIDQGAIKRLPAFIKKNGYKNVFIIADVNTWKAAGIKVAAELTKAEIGFQKMILPHKELIPDELALGEIFAAYPKQTDLVLAVGSGTINDICKFVSFQMNAEYIIFATAPSMDGFVSTGAALIIDHVKTSYETHGPAAVFGDVDILAAAPMNLITAGLGDILGKYTCLLDWKMARMIQGEYYCENIVEMVHNSLQTVVEQGPMIKNRNPKAVKAVTEALVLTGIAMSFVGNSRPASGCEHHLSHYWEMKFLMEGKKAIPHGTKVGVGMITALYLYKMLADEDIDFDAAMKKKVDDKAWEEKVIACYKTAAPGIIALEKKCGKNNVETRNERLLFYKENWKSIQETIRESTPGLEEMEELLLSLGGPVNPEQIGVSSELVKDGILLAKEVRERFTLLQILWDLGLLEEYGNRAVEYFTKKQQTYFRSLKTKKIS